MPSSPFAAAAVPLSLLAQMTRIGVESQMIIGLRMAGMMGMISMSPGETVRMITEKQEAASESALAVLRAATRGASPEQVMSAALNPYGRRTRANSSRLTQSRR